MQDVRRAQAADRDGPEPRSCVQPRQFGWRCAGLRADRQHNPAILPCDEGVYFSFERRKACVLRASRARGAASSARRLILSLRSPGRRGATARTDSRCRCPSAIQLDHARPRAALNQRAVDGLCRHPRPRHGALSSRVRANDPETFGLEHPASHALGNRCVARRGLRRSPSVHAPSSHRRHVGPR